MAAAAGAAVTSVVIVGSGSNYFGYDDDSERRSIASLENKSEAVVKFKNSPVPTRDQQMTRLTAGKEYDVLVIGGGATGSGVALDAQMRGLDTALIERGDFANETSSRSTKLIWAGIRYIATAVAQLLSFKTLAHPIDQVDSFLSEFKMVMGAHKERKCLLENNPHLTNWVPIAVPMKTWITWPAPFGHPIFALAPVTLPAVFKFYDSLAGFTCPPSHIMGKSRARRKFPQLDEDVKYVQVFYEGQHNDARTATYIALTAAEEGATVANYTEMVGVIRERGNGLLGDSGKAVGVRCRDNLTGKEFDVRAKAIIFAGGPFTDGMRKLEDKDCTPAVAAAAGTHVVLPGYYSPDGMGLLDINTSDGRFLFFLPWQGATLVGTTDRKGAAVSTPGPPEDEIQWILNEVEKYLDNGMKVRRSDVLSSWQGWRPLASDPNAPPGAPVSRDHIISTNPETDITFITGGKWTTYREMAEDVLDKVIERKGLKAGPCLTDKRPLRGGVGYTKNVPIQLVQEFGVSEETAKHLATSYGMNAFDVCKMAKPSGKAWPKFGNVLAEGHPHLECEIEYQCKNEMATSVYDMLTTRMRLAFVNREAAMAVAPRVADLMAQALGWSNKEKKRQLASALEGLAVFGGPIPQKMGSELSATTITDLRSLFAKFDTDGNGTMDIKEMMQMAEALGFPFKSSDEASATFRHMDKDGNGRITENEFVRWWHEEKDDDLRKKLGDQFKFSVEKLGDGSGSRGVLFG
jgi:glycerol-3-phosphate dehydrogenase